jgi:hypothetical protein
VECIKRNSGLDSTTTATAALTTTTATADN